MAKSYLVLDDGTIYEGESFGCGTEAFGEVVFTTEECGYQKSLTDPSYKGNIVVMTFPLIGNYLIHDEWFQSDKVQASAVICKEYSRTWHQGMEAYYPVNTDENQQLLKRYQGEPMRRLK